MNADCHKNLLESACDVVFAGLVEASTKAKLVVEFIKYICFQRQQIPVTYEQLQRELMNGITQITGPKKKLAVKQKEDAYNALKNSFSSLEVIFCNSQPRQIAVLVGATIVSPKEMFILRFPVAAYEGPLVNYRACLQVLFRSLVSESAVGELNEMKSLTKVFILVEAPRNIHSADFLQLRSLPTYKLPSRGKKFVFNFAFRARAVSAELSRIGEEFNISGVEPLETTMNELELSSRKAGGCHGERRNFKTPDSAFELRRKTKRLSVDSLGNISLLSLSDGTQQQHSNKISPVVSFQTPQMDIIRPSMDVGGDEDYVWYQLPQTVKGFREDL